MGYGRTRNLLGVALTLLVLLAAKPAHAATGLNLTTSPLPIKLSAAPGTTVKTTLRVKSNAPTPERLKVGLMKFGASGQTGQPSLSDRGPNDSYFDWVSFTPGEFTASPNQWVNVDMAIKIPKTAGLGYYYAVTFQRATDPTLTNEHKPQTSVVGATATLVLLDVKTADERRSMQLSSFTADHKFYQFLPATFSVTVRNTGNIFVTATGNIFVKKGTKTLATLNVNPAGGSVLPHSQRAFLTDWHDGFPAYKNREQAGKLLMTKNGLPQRSLAWDGGSLSKLRFGKYTAQALMVYNDGKHDVPLQATVSFWVIPWGAIVIIILIPLLPALLVYGAMHRHSHKHASWREHS